MGLQTDPDWEPWRLGTFWPPECGGHSYMHSTVQLVDLRRMGEKAFRSSGRFQVLHHHKQGQSCNDDCEAYGEGVPRLVDR